MLNTNMDEHTCSKCVGPAVSSRTSIARSDRIVASDKEDKEQSVHSIEHSKKDRTILLYVVSLMGTPASVMASVFRQSRDLRPSAESETRQKIEQAAALAARSAQPAAGATSAPPPRRAARRPRPRGASPTPSRLRCVAHAGSRPSQTRADAAAGPGTAGGTDTVDCVRQHRERPAIGWREPRMIDARSDKIKDARRQHPNTHSPNLN